MKKVAGKLRLDLAQFRELEAFAQFGSDLDEATKQKIERGKRTVEILKQGQYEPISVENQVAILFALSNGFVDEVPVEDITKWEAEFSKFMNVSHKDVLDEIKESGAVDEKLEEKLKKAISEFKL
jgi:F-type H+-transporting ATPase subunit alpha